MLSTYEELGTGEENIIRYMAGYVPFKLINTKYIRNTNKYEK